MNNAGVLERLTAIIDERKGADPGSSYVASLYHKGVDAILKKIGEEATELVMAAKDNDPDQIIYEAADLWFHIMVLMAHNDLSANDILCELDRRFGVSGVDEKAARVTK